jgi:hypothetical protein
MEGDAEEVVRSVVTAAKNGDMTAARIIIERLLPPKKDRPVSFALSDTCISCLCAQKSIDLGANKDTFCNMIASPLANFFHGTCLAFLSTRSMSWQWWEGATMN